MKLNARLGIAATLALLILETGCATPALWGKKVHSPESAPMLVSSPQTEDILVRYNEQSAAFSYNKNDPFVGWLYHPQHPTKAYWLFASTNKTTHPAFVDVTNLSNWISIPVASLNPMGRITGQPLPKFNLMFTLADNITNRADAKWLRHDKHNTSKLGHCIIVGNNALGQTLYITNAQPERAFYMMLSALPPRYIMITNAPPEKGYYAASLSDTFTLWRDGKKTGEFILPNYSTYAPPNFWRVVLTPFAVTVDTVIVAMALVGR